MGTRIIFLPTAQPDRAATLPDAFHATLTSRTQLYLPTSGIEFVSVILSVSRQGTPLVLGTCLLGPVKIGFSDRHAERPTEWFASETSADGSTFRVGVGPGAKSPGLRLDREMRGRRRHVWVLPGDVPGLPVLYAGAVLLC